jgi:hypothetical protein
VQDKGNSLQLTNPLGQFQFALKHMPTMPKNMLRTVYLSGFLVLASHLGTPLEPIGAQEIPEKQFLFQTLGAFKTGEISEDQLRRLDAIAQGSSPFAKVAAQTVCLSKLQRGDYRGLWSAVSNASEGNSPKSESDANTPETMAWANERILLYLAIEAHRSEQAAELLKSAVKRSLDIPDQFVAHGRLDAAFLGALCASAKSDTAKDRIAPELVTKAMDLMSKHPHKSLSMAFEESYQVVAKHLGQLESSMSLVAGLSDKDLDAELSKAQMQFQNANGVYKEASEGLAQGKKQSIAIDKDVQATRKLCAQSETPRLGARGRYPLTRGKSLLISENIDSIWLTCRAIRYGLPSGLLATKPASSGSRRSSWSPEPSLGDSSSPTKSKLKLSVS